ncbi:MAG: hypothetical protein AAF862_03010 [Pseudomonadota bacterium]
MSTQTSASAARVTMSAAMHEAVPSAPSAPPYHAKIVLRRTGKKTMRFAGDLIAEATGYPTAASHWYEVHVYSRVVGGYVAAIRHFFKGASQRDRFIAERFQGLSDMMAFIEEYRADAECAVDFDPADPKASAADIAIHAAGLRTRKAGYIAAYQDVAGDALDQLDKVTQT